MDTFSRRGLLFSAPAALLAIRAVGHDLERGASRWQSLDALCTEAIMERRTPGLAVAVARGSTLRFHRAYGVADVERRLAVVPDTTFCCASVTKQFVAVLCLLLQREGKLHLDERISRWLPEFPHSREISIRMLLNHTSGLPEYTDVSREQLAREARQDYSSEEIVTLMAHRSRTLRAPPGTAWSYSNTGYVLLGIIAERATGLPTGALLSERVFRPVGLPRTTWGPPTAEHARGYMFSDAGWQPAPKVSRTYLGGSGAIWTTVGDLCAWSVALHSRILGAAELAEFLAPAQFQNASSIAAGESTYGMGIRIGAALGRTVHWHSGSTPGYCADVRYYPADHTCIAMLANADASRMASFPRAARELALVAISAI